MQAVPMDLMVSDDDPGFRVYVIVLPIIGGLLLRVLYLTAWFPSRCTVFAW